MTAPAVATRLEYGKLMCRRHKRIAYQECTCDGAARWHHGFRGPDTGSQETVIVQEWRYCGRSRIRRAGTPAYRPSDRQSFVTTAPAAMTQPSPTLTPGSSTALAPIQHPEATTTGARNTPAARTIEVPIWWELVPKRT